MDGKGGFMPNSSNSPVSRPQRVDISGMALGDAVKSLKNLSLYADVELSEVPDKVFLSGVSLREAVRVYAEFEHQCFGSQVVEFTRNGKIHLRKEVVT